MTHPILMLSLIPRLVPSYERIPGMRLLHLVCHRKDDSCFFTPGCSETAGRREKTGGGEKTGRREETGGRGKCRQKAG